jgi:cell division protease FtsH
MRSLFKKARKLAKLYGGCIVFIDEIDSFGTPRRPDSGFGGQTSHNATINQFLTELDGLRKTENNIVVFAATNTSEEELDPAVMRSGRFDRKIRVERPSTADRIELINFYLGRIQYQEGINVALIAEKAMWFSAADIDNMVREAAVFAQRENRVAVTEADLFQGRHSLGRCDRHGIRQEGSQGNC